MKFELTYYITLIFTSIFVLNNILLFFILKKIKKIESIKFFKRKILNISIYKFIILWIVFLQTTSLIIIIVFLNNFFLSRPKIIYTNPEKDGKLSNYENAIEIEWDKPINTQEIKVNISDNLKADWVFEKTGKFSPFSKKIKIYPKQTVLPDEKIIFYFSNVTNFFKTVSGEEEIVTFYSDEPPKILSTNIEQNSLEYIPDLNITVSLDKEDSLQNQYEVEFSNNFQDFKIERDFDKSFSIKLISPLAQNTEYSITIYCTPVSLNISTKEILQIGKKKSCYFKKFKTVKPPLISSFFPQGNNILVNSKIQIKFDEKIEKDSIDQKIQITPNIKGNFIWIDEFTLEFIPEKLEKETSYEFTLKKGIKSQKGGLIDSDLKFYFQTIGAVKAINFYPRPNSSNNKVNTSLSITFDQEVDKESAQSKFFISPSVSGVFSWNGLTMIFKPSINLNYSTKYNFGVNSGVISINGINSREKFTSSFSTEIYSISLNVPLIKQTHAFTCNIAATAMALKFKGKSTSEMTVYNEIPKDNTECKKENSKIITWGNPHIGYVGNIDGSGECGGYGIYWEPISSYLTSKGVSNKIISGSSINELTLEIQNGHPIIIWWQNGWSSPINKSWTTPSGQYIYAVQGMHSEVVIGFIGPQSNPTHIITNDPWRGRRKIPISSFDSLWKSYFNRTGIVIY